MPLLTTEVATIAYSEAGQGPALLLLAPGGMRSQASFWRTLPGDPSRQPPWIDPVAELADRFRVIEMDQRNAGASTAPITAADGWHSYADDQLALLDHLGVGKFSLMGGCIGCSFALRLAAATPGRVQAAVLQNPIGLSLENGPLFNSMFDEWAGERGAALMAGQFRDRMFGGEFVFSVSRDFVRSLDFPILILPGNDNFHPPDTAAELAELAPRATVKEDWREDRAGTAAAVRDFLIEATA